MDNPDKNTLPKSAAPDQKNIPLLPQEHQHGLPRTDCGTCNRRSSIKVALGLLFLVAACAFVIEAYMRYKGSSLITFIRPTKTSHSSSSLQNDGLQAVAAKEAETAPEVTPLTPEALDKNSPLHRLSTTQTHEEKKEESLNTQHHDDKKSDQDDDEDEKDDE